MTAHLRTFAPALALAVLAAACESKATGPSVTFITSAPSAPNSGSTYTYAQQPITISFANATLVSAGTATYSVEVASDSAFTKKVFTKDSITENASGTTSVTLSTLDGATTYYWRSRATVAGTAGEYSSVRSFSIGPRVVVDKPVLSGPTSGQTFYAVPTLTTKNATRVGPVTTMRYTFQLSTSASFSSIAQQATVVEGTGGTAGVGGTTSWTPTITLSETTYYWRVRAADDGTGEASSFSDSLNWVQKKGIDLTKIVITLGAQSYPSWPQTNTVTDAYHEGDRECITTEGEAWPTTGFFGDPSVQVEGNIWNFLQIDGTWYAGAGHWYRPGQDCKGEVDDLFFIEGFLGAYPFSTFRPYDGLIFGIGVSTPARVWPDMKTLDHRSNVVLIPW